MVLGFAEGLPRAGEFLASLIEKEGLDIIATKDLETNNDNSITVVNALTLKGYHQQGFNMDVRRRQQ